MGDLTKVSMNLSHRSLANIDDINNVIKEDNKTRAVSSALQIAKMILDQVEKGNRIIIRDKNDCEREMFIVF